MIPILYLSPTTSRGMISGAHLFIIGLRSRAFTLLVFDDL